MTAKRANMHERAKRALYRACHRGTKEMDWLLGRFAEAKVASMNETEIDAFETLLAMPDPDLENWITNAPDAAPKGDINNLIGLVRAFHGLKA